MKKLFIATIMLATTISPLAATDAHFEVALSHGGLRLLKGNPPQARKLAWGCADTATVITDKAAYSEIPPLYKPTHQEAEHLLIESDQIGKAAFFNLVLVEGKLALRHYNWHRQQMVFYVLSKTGIGQRYSVKLDDMIAAIAHSSPAPTERLIKAADYQRVNRILRNLREEMDSYSKGTYSCSLDGAEYNLFLANDDLIYATKRDGLLPTADYLASLLLKKSGPEFSVWREEASCWWSKKVDITAKLTAIVTHFTAIGSLESESIETP